MDEEADLSHQLQSYLHYNPQAVLSFPLPTPVSFWFSKSHHHDVLKSWQYCFVTPSEYIYELECWTISSPFFSLLSDSFWNTIPV